MTNKKISEKISLIKKIRKPAIKPGKIILPGKGVYSRKKEKIVKDE